ncbi:uncharacterized protein BJ171DRAFT_461484 [Polychytrium aggregatum]|uniref:uncharacterized protein n=1 Tax=Polychytrium aggregatum TaxID=110093 RepID=UPI0022FEB640|nr:uncharacterized protein BJ171DRAFT_461484 [Polychytrium aggregatum]KAI9202328.1 hypothetical protein BJ171DRAFT_461484 [Polychytrium aggregatum]
MAVKVMCKRQVLEWNQERHVLQERKIISKLHHPLIVQCYGAFQDLKHLYLILEFVPGGDLYQYLHEQTRFEEPKARFYAAEVICALGYIHSAHQTIYRDLKPENILVTEQGHIKLTDFGFAKMGTSANSFCGTPSYMAPEMILRKDYTAAVDWWACGILIFEMISGYAPFQGETSKESFEKILGGQIKWPVHVPVGPIRDILKGLLAANPLKRLGSKSDAKDLKSHPWFIGVDWAVVDCGGARPPFQVTSKSSFNVAAAKDDPKEEISIDDLDFSDSANPDYPCGDNLNHDDSIFESW